MGKKSGSRRKLISDLILTGLIACVMTLVSLFHYWDFLNWKLFDVLIGIRRVVPKKSENVVIVCIDQKSLKFVYDKFQQPWAWPREFHARLVRHLSACGARAILFDVIFSEPDTDRTNASPGEVCDKELGNAIHESGVTYLSAALQDSLAQNPFRESIFLEENNAFSKLSIFDKKTAVFPIEVLTTGAAGIGFADCVPEDDGIHRRYPLVFKFNNRHVPSTGFLIAKNLLGDETVIKNFLDTIGENTMVDSKGRGLINWYGKGGPDNGVFTYYSYHAVLVSSIQVERNEEPVIPCDAFKDKIVIIGSNAPGLFDLKATPFTFKEPYPGMEIHATAIENFLNNDFIYRFPSWTVVASIIAVSLILFLIHNRLNNLRIFIPAFAVLVVLELIASYIILLCDAWITAVDIIAGTTFVFIGLVVAGYFSESKDKRLLRKQFERYVNDTVLEEILENPKAVDVKGRTLSATIMATDIKDFTTISEKLPPYEVVSRLNDYLSEVTESLIENKAFINKYIGDAILAVYGAFEENNHRRNACYAAIQTAKIINQKADQARRENRIPFITRFGINSGEITMGNIGSKRKTEYTVIGDTVNSAFRLEGLNKYYGTILLSSEFTHDGAGDEFEFRCVDFLRFKGKVKPVRIFELLGLKGRVDSALLQRRDKFEEALGLYQKGDFTMALELFSLLNEEGDKASETFIERCRNFLASPPPSEWDGVWVMDKK